MIVVKVESPIRAPNSIVLDYLAGWAEMSAALTDKNALHRGTTGGALLPLAPINGELILKITPAVDPVNAGSIAADAFLECLANRLPEHVRL